MDLPVEKWKSYVKQKWTLLEPSLKKRLCSALSLQDHFLLVSSLFQPEDEECLHHLAGNYCVKKDPGMVQLYKAEGNERFRKKQYQTAGMLYSKVPGIPCFTGASSVNTRNRIFNFLVSDFPIKKAICAAKKRIVCLTEYLGPCMNEEEINILYPN